MFSGGRKTIFLLLFFTRGLVSLFAELLFCCLQAASHIFSPAFLHFVLSISVDSTVHEGSSVSAICAFLTSICTLWREKHIVLPNSKKKDLQISLLE